MLKHNCEKCNFRRVHDTNPGSLLGRLWRWHINWCPGWKSYMNSLQDAKKTELHKRYNLGKKQTPATK